MFGTKQHWPLVVTGVVRINSAEKSEDAFIALHLPLCPRLQHLSALLTADKLTCRLISAKPPSWSGLAAASLSDSFTTVSSTTITSCWQCSLSAAVSRASSWSHAA